VARPPISVHQPKFGLGLNTADPAAAGPEARYRVPLCGRPFMLSVRSGCAMSAAAKMATSMALARGMAL
jgi:hypothetical protein